jgi:hypothetical protein
MRRHNATPILVRSCRTQPDKIGSGKAAKEEDMQSTLAAPGSPLPGPSRGLQHRHRQISSAPSVGRRRAARGLEAHGSPPWQAGRRASHQHQPQDLREGRCWDYQWSPAPPPGRASKEPRGSPQQGPGSLPEHQHRHLATLAPTKSPGAGPRLSSSA